MKSCKANLLSVFSAVNYISPSNTSELIYLMAVVKTALVTFCIEDDQNE